MSKIIELNKIYNEDCLEGSERIPSGSVDLILTDPPYGNMNGIDEEYAGYGRKNGDGHGWDVALNPESIHKIANRILRKNGKMVLFSQEPYTTHLVTKASANVPFSYRAIWEKNDFANALLSKKAMVGYYEDILVFSKKHDFEGIHPLRGYFEAVKTHIGIEKKEIVSIIGQRADHSFRTKSSQFSLCTEKTYRELIDVFKINEMPGFKDFRELQKTNSAFNLEFNSVFNLWEGKKYKSNVLKYKKDYDGYHPTQKPVLLLEDLIKTFSNEGDTVVDLTMGSGSAAVACLKTNRNFIGFELDETYFKIANERIASN